MLLDIQTGREIAVQFIEIERRDLSRYEIAKNKGWIFDWRDPYKDGFQVYGLFVPGQLSIPQGLVAISPNYHPNFSCVEMQIVESAPHNKRGVRNRRYQRVGAHLVAFACKKSFDYGFDGYVDFVTKTPLIAWYKQLGAILKSGQTMYFNTNGSTILIRQCNI